jgi:hypothetical protein
VKILKLHIENFLAIGAATPVARGGLDRVLDTHDFDGAALTALVGDCQREGT